MTVRAALAAMALATLLGGGLTACGGEEPAPDGPRAVLVGLNATDSEVLVELHRRLLDQAGFTTRVREVKARELYVAPLAKGTAQVAVDYLSSAAEALHRRAEGQDAAPVGSPVEETALATLTDLARDQGLTVLRPARAEGSTQYAVTPELARSLRLASLSDLGRSGRSFSLGAFPDCVASKDCATGLERTYGITLDRVEPLEGVATEALAAGEVQVVQVASTDPALDSGALVALRDDRSLLYAENVVPLVNTAWLADHEDAREALEKLAAVLTTEDLRAMVGRVADGDEVGTVAQDYLTEQDLL